MIIVFVKKQITATVDKTMPGKHYKQKSNVNSIAPSGLYETTIKVRLITLN